MRSEADALRDGGLRPWPPIFPNREGTRHKSAKYLGAGPRERDVPAGTALLQVSWRANEITKTDSHLRACHRTGGETSVRLELGSPNKEAHFPPTTVWTVVPWIWLWTAALRTAEDVRRTLAPCSIGNLAEGGLRRGRSTGTRDAGRGRSFLERSGRGAAGGALACAWACASVAAPARGVRAVRRGLRGGARGACRASALGWCAAPRSGCHLMVPGAACCRGGAWAASAAVAARAAVAAVAAVEELRRLR